MSFQTSRLSTRVVTLSTLVRFFTGVHTHMNFQVMWILTRVITLSALVRLPTSVHSEKQFKARLLENSPPSHQFWLNCFHIDRSSSLFLIYERHKAQNLAPEGLKFTKRPQISRNILAVCLVGPRLTHKRLEILLHCICKYCGGCVKVVLMLNLFGCWEQARQNVGSHWCVDSRSLLIEQSDWFWANWSTNDCEDTSRLDFQDGVSFHHRMFATVLDQLTCCWQLPPINWLTQCVPSVKNQEYWH